MRAFEKHVTLKRAVKGTDHRFAFEPEGFRKFSRDIKRVRHMMPPKPGEDTGNEYVFQKLGKSLTAGVDIKKGEKLTLDNLSGRILDATYIPVRESNRILGLAAKVDIPKGELIRLVDLEV